MKLKEFDKGTELAEALKEAFVDKYSSDAFNHKHILPRITDALAKFGEIEIDLDQWLKDNGWVKDFPHWLADMPEDKVDAFCKMKGYIKLSDVELNVEKAEEIVEKIWCTQMGGNTTNSERFKMIAQALSNNLKDLLKVKGE